MEDRSNIMQSTVYEGIQNAASVSGQEPISKAREKVIWRAR